MTLSIPMPLLVSIDDAGWWMGQDGSAVNQPFRTGMPRAHCLEDYTALVALGRSLDMKIPAGFVLCEWDQTQLLREVPSATWMAEQWKSPFTDLETKEKAAQIIQSGSDHLELAVHGVGHEFWDQGRMSRSEFHDTKGKIRSRDLVKKHLEYFFRLMDSFGLAQAPRIFIPPALHHGFGNGAKGFQAIARSFGIQYIPLVFSRADCSIALQFIGLGWEEGVLLMERGRSQTKWNQVAAPPKFTFNSPILALHWANILHPNPDKNMDVIHAWSDFLKKGVKENQVVLSRDISACLTQYLNATQSRIHVKGNKIVVFLDWIDKLPAKALADTLFFSLDLPKGLALRLSGTEIKRPRNQNEAGFIKTGMPKAGKIVFEYSQSF
ncbi:hypothetical protein [uncultured Desulfobacter sp.]|uniref:hypothetical protein n=1 Tax=uncultured Desulfobacter sp. TaxID=240139 RepID=UPI0029F47777|nr:hypothetical protein [uncultured Desulfobacter sp.]